MPPCETCRYYGLRTKTCDYIIFTRRRRGCKVGEECSKYEERDGPRRTDIHLPGDDPYWLYKEIGNSAGIVRKITKGKLP